MSRWALVPALALALLAAALFAPFLLKDRELVAATPSPRPLFNATLVKLPPDQPLCLSDVTIPPDAQLVRFQVTTAGGPGPELAITLKANGYEERVTVPGGYPDGATLAPPITPPKQARLGTVCIARKGTAPVALTASDEERTQSRPEGRIGDNAVPADTYLAFYERGTASPLSKLGAIVDRMGAFRPGVVGPWVLWPLLALTILGVPAGVLWAALRATR